MAISASAVRAACGHPIIVADGHIVELTPVLHDAELSAALCRAVNCHHARTFARYADRMTVGALIPMHTPDVAIGELRYAVNELGLKAAVMSGYARRPIPRLEREHGRLTPPVYHLDHFGLDSDYDYLVGQWEKRNAASIVTLDPDRLDVPALMAYVDSYGYDDARAARHRLQEWFSAPAGRPAQLDEFAAVHLEKAEELRDKFVTSFYLGCEADDPLVAWAFDDRVNPLGARLRVVFGSGISHWDVPDMARPVVEA